LKNDLNQITIVTPLPKTKLWEQLDSKFGIVEKDYRKFDTKHLVWRHPNISKARIEKLMDWGLRLSNPRKGFLRMFYRLQRLLYRNEGLSSLGVLPKSLYYSKKFNPDGYKIFFDDDGDLVKYKFNFNS
jgi:hypothetical protein